MAATLPVRTRLEMPFLLLCGMGMSAFFASLGAVAYCGVLVGSLFSRHFTVDGRAVSRGKFWQEMLPLLLAYPLIVAAFGLIAYGLWKEQLWTPRAVMGFWAALALANGVAAALHPTDGASLVSGVLGLAMGWGLAAWYFYGQASVRAYYQALAQRAAAPQGPGEPAPARGDA